VKFIQLIFGASLCLALVGTASASTQRTNLGALPDGEFGTVGHALAHSQSFQDTVHVARSTASTISKAVLPIRLTNATSNLSSRMSLTTRGALSGKYTFSDLTPGAYTAAIFGTANYLDGYGATYRASVAAVPEMETWLMLLIGVGLAAYQLHRKQKTLGQQVLNDEALNSA
jgi:hypothetical protein